MEIIFNLCLGLSQFLDFCNLISNLAWFYYKENQSTTMEDGTIDFEPLWNNAINQTSSFIPMYQNCKVEKIKKKIFNDFLK